MTSDVLKKLKLKMEINNKNKPFFITNQPFVKKMDRTVISKKLHEENIKVELKDPNEMVTVAMCTQPCRKEQMLKTVRKILPQCDRLCICFNEYEEIPQELPKSDKLICVLAGKGKQYEDLGCMNKMLWCGDFPGYYATIDDDIEYCDGYIEHLKKKVDEYNRKCICSFHGHIYPTTNGKIKYDKRVVMCYNKKFKTDTFCHRIGNGCAMYYPSEIGLTKNIFLDRQKNFGDDEVLTIWAQKNKIPLIRIENKDINLLENTQLSKLTSLYKNKKSQSQRKKYLEQYTEWKLNKYERDCFFRIIIPTYNSELFLQKCIYSIINQTFQNFKIIIVDDCSNDETRSLILKLYTLFPDKIEYEFCNERCYGGKCRNIGLNKNIKSDYVLFLDSDDYYYNNEVLQNIYNAIQTNNYPDLVKCSFFTCEKKTLSKPKIIGDKFTDVIKLFSPWTSCVKSTMCPQFKEDRIRFNDVIWSLRCYDKIETFYTLKKPCVVYNLDVNPNSCQHAKMDAARMAAIYYLLGDLLNCDFKKPDVNKKVHQIFKMKTDELLDKNFYFGMLKNDY